MKLNQELFEFSCDNPEPLVDDAYTFIEEDGAVELYYKQAKLFKEKLKKFETLKLK